MSKAIIFIFMCGIVAILAIDFVGKQEWKKYKEDHNCRSTEKITGQSGYDWIEREFYKNPDQIGWLCDDGVTYWRNK